MAVYWFNFTPNPADSAGLSPTFLNFIKFDGTTLAPPGITQTNTGTGIYQFNYTPSFSIAFRLDGLTTALGGNRYITGALDVSDKYAIDDVGSTLLSVAAAIGNQGQTLVATGVTLVAIGNTVLSLGATLGPLAGLIGNTSSIYGGSAADPTTLFGYMKRIQEFLEGNQSFTKSTGVWGIYSRLNATLLINKALQNDSTGVTRS